MIKIKMKKSNSIEFNPFNKLVPSDDFFSFLDGEVYYIGYVVNGVCEKFIRENKLNHVIAFDGTVKSPFLFEWEGRGYKIRSAENPEFIITLSLSDIGNLGYITLERDENSPNQIWDVLVYDHGKSGFGISIRSLIPFSSGHIYLGCTDYNVSAEYDIQINTCLMLMPVSEWLGFGMICMQYLNWIFVTEADVNKALNNYFSNMNTKLSPDCILSYNNLQLIVNQSGGNFPRLHYADVTMDKVACEAIAVCNAIRIVRNKTNPSNSDLFRLVAEFELSGLYKNSLKKLVVFAGSAFGIKTFSKLDDSEGSWGGDPDLIGFCLEAHGIKFRQIHIKNCARLQSRNKKSENCLIEFDEEIIKADAGIVSYNFDKLNQAIHTFACKYEGDLLKTFNRLSNHTPEGDYLNTEKSDVEREIYKSVSQALSPKVSYGAFYTGYLIYKK